MKDQKYHNFINALREVTGDVDDPVSHFHYVGSCECPAVFRRLLPGKSVPHPLPKCLCKTKIAKQFWIYNKERDIVMTVGSSCIQRWMPDQWDSVVDSLRRKCTHCGETNRCRKDEFCSDCRGGILRFGKYKGKTYRKVLQEDPDYCKWVLRTPGRFDGFKNWLING